MRHVVILGMLSAGLALGGCGGGSSTSSSTTTTTTTTSVAPTKRQPGSWSSKIEIVKLEGPDIKPGTREQMQQMLSMMSGMSVCVTPEAAAAEDVSKNLENSAGSKDCTFDKRNISGDTLEFSGTCQRDGKKVRMTASGKNGATAQDITIKVEPLSASGAAEGVMEMRITSAHQGACKPGDITPPGPGAAKQ